MRLSGFQSYGKDGLNPLPALHIQTSVMLFHDPLGKGQTNTRTGTVKGASFLIEASENFPYVFRCYSLSVVPHLYHGVFGIPIHYDPDFAFVWSVLESIRHKIVHHFP